MNSLMSAPRELCCQRGVVAVLASVVVISLTALTGGVAPASAQPDTESVAPATSATVPFPGLEEPQQGPLPGDFRMRLATDAAVDYDRREVILVAAAGVVVTLGFGALGLAFLLGRRRPPEH